MNKILIAVLKAQRDQDILLKEKWYRIPVKYAPKHKYDIIAFYQPANFKESGKRIEYYGIVRSSKICKRKKLIKDGIRSDDQYYKISFFRIVKLKDPIVNDAKLRVSFKYTTFAKLYSSSNMGELFDVPDIEGMVEGILQKLKLSYKREYVVKATGNKRYRLDFAVFLKDKTIDIECDSEKWHSLKAQKLIDSKRNSDLRALGFEIIRLREDDIVNNKEACIKNILQICS